MWRLQKLLEGLWESLDFLIETIPHPFGGHFLFLLPAGST